MTSQSERDTEIEVLKAEIVHVRELFDIAKTYHDKAMELASLELARRLDLLNHAEARERELRVEMQDKYLRIDMYESRHKELQGVDEATDARVKIIEQNLWKIVGGMIAAWGIIQLVKFHV